MPFPFDAHLVFCFASFTLQRTVHTGVCHIVINCANTQPSLQAISGDGMSLLEHILKNILNNYPKQIKPAILLLEEARINLAEVTVNITSLLDTSYVTEQPWKFVSLGLAAQEALKRAKDKNSKWDDCHIFHRLRDFFMDAVEGKRLVAGLLSTAHAVKMSETYGVILHIVRLLKKRDWETENIDVFMGRALRTLTLLAERKEVAGANIAPLVSFFEQLYDLANANLKKNKSEGRLT